MPDRQYWLVKSEADVFSFDDLLESPKRTTYWDGVRSYAARIHLRAMKKGDLVLYYHSNAIPTAVVGVAEVVREAYPDHSAFDSKSPYFDVRSKPDDPSWFMVDLRAVEKLVRPVTLDEVKKEKSLAQMALVKLGRLSVQPVTPKEYETIRAMANR
jgi:predicted RNA-binding protein with PUA-like domain